MKPHMIENELFSLVFSFAELASSVVIWISYLISGMGYLLNSFVLSKRYL
jgi:hypothetical protein